MTKITLHRVKRKTGSVWMMRWYDSRGRRCGDTIGKVGVMTKRQAEHVRRERQGKLDNRLIPRDRPKRSSRMTLSQFNDYYLDRRKQQTSVRGYRKQAPKLTESTLRSHKTALMYLTAYFGETCRLDGIAVDQAEAWIEALEAGQFAETKGKNRTYGKDLSESSVRLYASKAKAIYNWAKLVGLVQTNPFDDLDTALIGAETRTYVSVDQFETVIDKSPSAGWSAMFGLCRLAGLRREAARSLPWSGSAVDSKGRKHWTGIDWDRRRVCVVGNHKTKRKYREIPICPRLYDLLIAARSVIDGMATVSSILTSADVLGRAQRIVVAAGVTPWPRMFQSMRSSCENDWKQQGVAEATYCAWLGHSPRVSREHYVEPMDSEFDAITQAA